MTQDKEQDIQFQTFFYNTPMMKAIGKYYKGCKISNPNKDITYTKYILGFIDDKTQYEND